MNNLTKTVCVVLSYFHKKKTLPKKSTKKKKCIYVCVYIYTKYIYINIYIYTHTYINVWVRIE